MTSKNYDKEKVASVNRQIGKLVRRVRERRGIAQSELAAKVGVLGPQMHKYETGAQRISSGMLYAIAHVMDVKTSTLLPANRNAED